MFKNFKMSYYRKQRTVHYMIHVVMIAFLIASLFPIGWMVFNSLKDNTEILSGRIPLNRAANDCIKMRAEGDDLWAFSANGGITKLGNKTLKKLAYLSTKTYATSFDIDDDHIWVSSARRGLIKIDKKKLKIVKKFKYPLLGIDLSKVASTVTLSNGNRVWVAVEYKGLQKILEFNKDTGNFRRLIDIESRFSPFVVRAMAAVGGTLWAGGNKGLLEISLSDGSVVNTYNFRNNGEYAQVSSIAKVRGALFLGTSLGAYKFSLPGKNVSVKYDSSWGLASDQINSISVHGDVLLMGTGGGMSMLNLKTGRISNAAELFTAIKNGTKKDSKKLVQAEVFSTAYVYPQVFLGTTKGRISVFDLSKFSVVESGILKKGSIIVRWRNYIDMWRNIDFGLYLRNSVIICGIATLLAMILATLAAYSLSRFKFPGSKQFSLGILATQMIPAIMYLIPIYITFVKITEFTGIPIKGTYYGVILVYSAFFVPFSIWILRGFFAAIPVELEEAARIDGCSPFQVFWHVVLPLAVPGIIATGVYIFLTAWDELMFAWVLTNADTMTIPVGIRNFVGNYQNRFDLMMAAASVATFPVLILFFMLQKYIVKGLTAGAVKG
jgi:multiple sugar transport system permease protein